jgi:hypothetical protein
VLILNGLGEVEKAESRTMKLEIGEGGYGEDENGKEEMENGKRRTLRDGSQVG